MIHAELIYSVGGIFKECLHDYDADKFLIAEYQRGYKWGSLEGEAVDKLLDDLYQAFKSSNHNKKNTDYYLQYITLKPGINIDNVKILEVIDGQQRLTTLSILCAIFRLLSENKIENVANNKLVYAVRDKFMDEFVYDENITKLTNASDWNHFTTENKLFDKQDVYYIYQAAKKISAELDKIKDELLSFYDYILNDVKIIVNAVEQNIESEKVFRNLNGNKVPLSQAELIKGLLLTKTAREKEDEYQKKHFKEIMEIRSTIGRQWDEMARWLNNSEIKSFYFSSSVDGIEAILEIVAVKNGFKSAPTKFALFNFIQKQINSGIHSSSSYFQDLKLVFSILRELYSNDRSYNMLGFIFFNKTGGVKKALMLQKLIEDILKNEKGYLSIIEQEMSSLSCLKKELDISVLEYGDKNELIHDVLFALNVFPKVQVRFSFVRFINESWSLEHIFPQNPRASGYKLSEEELEFLKELVGEKWDSELESLLTKVELQKEELEYLDRKLKADAVLLNSIGNMSLLTRGNNSSMSNGLFNAKRKNIVKLVSSGSFVPTHTFNVFSKLILEESKSLTFWNKEDINLHSKYLINEFSRVSNLFIK